MIKRSLIVLCFASCSALVADIPDGGSLQAPNDAGAVADTGYVAGLNCADDERADEVGRVCVPTIGTAACAAGASVHPEHQWLQAADTVLHAAPDGTGDGSSAAQAGSLPAMVAAAGDGSTAIILAQGTYAINDALALGVRGPLSLIGACAAQTTLELDAPISGAQGLHWPFAHTNQGFLEIRS